MLEEYKRGAVSESGVKKNKMVKELDVVQELFVEELHGEHLPERLRHDPFETLLWHHVFSLLKAKILQIVRATLQHLNSAVIRKNQK